ncbi:MAG: SagB/ThcOx family dehydrogenase [Halobacteriales archaeon]|nr:SagB/ThcOx family dehydrogenase [Halobacteriales archaeon]
MTGDTELQTVRQLNMHETVSTTRHLNPVRSFWSDHRHRTRRTGDIAELYHENTKLTDRMQHRLALTVQAFEKPGMDRLERDIAPDHYDRPLITLPPPREINTDLDKTLADRRSSRTFDERSLTPQTVATMLAASCGTLRRADSDDASSRYRRPYPSAGALYPIECYCAIGNVETFDPGLYYYSQKKHGLRVLDTDAGVTPIDEAFAGADVFADWGAGLVLIFSGVFARTTAKYGPRGYRYVLQESGHLAQNVLLAATGLELAAVPLAAFDDRRMNRVLGVDGVNEAVVYTLAIGTLSGGTQ